MRLLWPLGVRWIHDAVLEDLLDRAEAAVGAGPARPARWSPWVRLLRRLDGPRARPVPVPETPLLATALPRVDRADAYSVRVFRGASTDPQVWADAIFRDLPRWVIGAAGSAREPGGVGGASPVAGARRSTRWPARPTRCCSGRTRLHLDFRASVLREPHRVVLSTVVQLHNRRGRAYFAPVGRVHPMIVRAMLSRAARRLSRSSNPVRPDGAIIDA